MITFIGKKEILNFLQKELYKYEVFPSNKHIKLEYKHSMFIIKVYKSNTITIQGKKESDIYNKFIEILDENNYLGMDEVGVGDFFGPTVYTIVKFTNEDKNKLYNLNLSIKDSKKLKDSEIISIYNQIENIIKYEVEIIWDKDIPNNLNSIDQKMYYHYKNYSKIKFETEEKIVIDLFTTINNFQKVAKKLEVNYPEDKLILENQADSKYFVVALASIISRYYFVKEMEKLNKKYNFNFPYGANVKEAAQKFISEYSKEELSSFCKTTFKTFDELGEK